MQPLNQHSPSLSSSTVLPSLALSFLFSHSIVEKLNNNYLLWRQQVDLIIIKANHLFRFLVNLVVPSRFLLSSVFGSNRINSFLPDSNPSSPAPYSCIYWFPKCLAALGQNSKLLSFSYLCSGALAHPEASRHV